MTETANETHGPEQFLSRGHHQHGDEAQGHAHQDGFACPGHDSGNGASSEGCCGQFCSFAADLARVKPMVALTPSIGEAARQERFGRGGGPDGPMRPPRTSDMG